MHAILSFAWGWNISPWTFRSCLIWSIKFTTLTNRKLLDLKARSVWATLYTSLQYWRVAMDFFAHKFSLNIGIVLLETVNRKVFWGTQNYSSLALLWKLPFGKFIFKCSPLHLTATEVVTGKKKLQKCVCEYINRGGGLGRLGRNPFAI